jgi:5-formyltetrahydrofolate cyclo-ligase
MRDRLLVARRARSADARAAAGDALAEHLLSAPEVQRAGTVAAYVSVGTEPPTQGLLEHLRRQGVGVLLPVLLPDLDLAWGEYAGAQSLEHGPRGMRQPGGRGGGSYDRALARLGPGVWSCVLLYADEVLDTELPADPHDQRVHAAATPEGIVRFRP